jgi:hypothetical protein
MKYRRRRLAVVALIPLCLFGNLAGHAQTSSETRAVSVLFKHFETVAYTRTDFLSSLDALDTKNVDSEEALKLPFGELIAGLKALEPNTASDLAKSYSAVLAGAQDFGKEPNGREGFGMASSRKCYVGILEGGAQPNVELNFRKAFYESIDGKQVWTWSKPDSGEGSKLSKYYAAQVAGSYFVMANNRQDFQELANALISADTSKPPSISASGWNTFSAYHYWAYRLIRRSGVVSSDGDAIDPDVIRGLRPDVNALAFFVDVDKRESFIQVFSSDTSMKTVPKILPNSELSRLQPQGAGIWQATIPLSKDEAGFAALIKIFYSFGFGVAL